MESEINRQISATNMVAQSSVAGHPDVDPKNADAFIKSMLDQLLSTVPYYNEEYGGGALQRAREAAVERYKQYVANAIKDKSVTIETEKKIEPVYIKDRNKNV